MLAAQKPDPDSHRTLRPVVDPDTAWSVIALVNLAKVTHTNFRRAQETRVDVAGVDALGPQGVALQVQRLGAIRF